MKAKIREAVDSVMTELAEAAIRRVGEEFRRETWNAKDPGVFLECDIVKSDDLSNARQKRVRCRVVSNLYEVDEDRHADALKAIVGHCRVQPGCYKQSTVEIWREARAHVVHLFVFDSVEDERANNWRYSVTCAGELKVAEPG